MNKRKKNPRYLVLFSAVIIVLFVIMFLLNRATDEAVDTTKTTKAPDLIGQPIMGSDEAKVTIVEFGDYKCPSCKAWGEQIFPPIKQMYIDTGKVKFSYINVLFHGEESTLGALASESVFAQNPESFWDFHKRLFAAQPSGDHDSLWLTSEKVLEVANTLGQGIDAAKLQTDMSNQTTMTQVNEDTKLVQEFNVQQTPTIMVNDIVITNPFDYKLIVRVIEEQLGK
jgi:protein-disulfide isomerase